MSGSHGHDEPLPEPKTPMWLPALGAVLFLTAGIWWALQASDNGNVTADTTTIASASAAPATPPPMQTAQQQGQGGSPRPQLPPGATVLHPKNGPRPANDALRHP